MKDELNFSHNGGVVVYLLQSGAIHLNLTVVVIFLKTIQIVFGGKTILKPICPENPVLRYLLSSIPGYKFQHHFNKYKNRKSATANTLPQPELETLYETSKEVREKR